jgi:hypothetical protein
VGQRGEAAPRVVDEGSAGLGGADGGAVDARSFSGAASGVAADAVAHAQTDVGDDGECIPVRKPPLSGRGHVSVGLVGRAISVAESGGAAVAAAASS